MFFFCLETNKRRTSNFLFLSFFLLVSLQYITPKFIWNTKIYKENAVGETEKKTMYKPTAKNIRLCNGDKIVCPTPTEELGIFAGNIVYDAAGPTIGDTRSTWNNYMVLLDPVTIEDDNGPLQQYQSSFAYTDYSYQGLDDYSVADNSAKQRVPEFPITGTF